MPPPLAAAAILLFIAVLFREELTHPDTQRISWVPFVWMFLAASRFASYWLQLGSPLETHAYDDGSPIDRAVFGVLIAWALVTLARRKIRWRLLLASNVILVSYLLFCLASIAWTAEPFVLGKRWIKDLGNPLMALVMLTEPRPYEALAATLRRLSFVTMPLSLLFVKYYPEFGRGYTWSGSPMYTGIGHQKNDLGLMCLLAGVYFAWAHLWRNEDRKSPIESKWYLHAPLLVMVVWLLYMSNSQTSLVCLVVALSLLILARRVFRADRARLIVPIVIQCALMVTLLQAAFDIKAGALPLLGRREDLTNRTEIWEIVLRHAEGPMLGAGFMSYWNPHRTDAVRRELGAPLNQAHNGYLEQYLNLGYVGVAFIAAIIAVALARIHRQAVPEPKVAVLRLTFVVCIVLYNYTEAAFYGINNMWVVLLAVSIAIPSNVLLVRPLNLRRRGAAAQ